MPWNKRLTLVGFFLSVGVSLLLTVALWQLFGFAGFVGLLFLPFLWHGFRLFGGDREPEERESWYKSREPAKGRCPVCGWEAETAEDRYCPRDGSYLR